MTERRRIASKLDSYRRSSLKNVLPFMFGARVYFGFLQQWLRLLLSIKQELLVGCAIFKKFGSVRVTRKAS